MKSLPSLWLSIASILAFAPLSSAQISKARGPYEEIQSLQKNLDPSRSEEDLKRMAVEIREACSDVLDAIETCGEDLAESLGPFDDERGRFRKFVLNVIQGVNGVHEACKSLLDNVSSDNCRDVQVEAIALERSWLGLNQEISDTRKFLTEGLKTAGLLSNNLFAAGEEWEKLVQAGHEQAVEEHAKLRALHMELWGLEAKVKTAELAKSQVHKTWIEFVKAGGDGNSDKGRAIEQAWLAAVIEVQTAEGNFFEVWCQYKEMQEEQQKSTVERNKANQNLRKFIERMSESDSELALTEFKLWVELFQKDVDGSV